VITADQVVLLEHYFKLARFLQPSIIVVEDVDLIARERTQLLGLRPGDASEQAAQ
jgi:ATP-dependent 26S proteasome regulatory subunit